ncbi:hypothetical protein [Chlorobium sp. KB01]|uniref:hypothetical protein n=1 Tax=Chlorobium sp. KB01 TaxID=1917528 RepID=UPI0009774146|nr:hypothetical protein [Chlorobium sp. KB01]
MKYNIEKMHTSLCGHNCYRAFVSAPLLRGGTLNLFLVVMNFVVAWKNKQPVAGNPDCMISALTTSRKMPDMMRFANVALIARTIFFLLAIASIAWAGEVFAENSVTVQTKITVNISESLIQYFSKLRKETAIKQGAPPSTSQSRPSPADSTSVPAP